MNLILDTISDIFSFFFHSCMTAKFPTTIGVAYSQGEYTPTKKYRIIVAATGGIISAYPVF